MKLKEIFFGKKESSGLDIGLTKTKEGFFARLAKAISGKATIDTEVLDNIEETLIASDVGTTTSAKIIANLQARVAKNKNIQSGEIYSMLKEEMSALLTASNNTTPELPEGVPYVIMVVGVNGVGKTTTIGKLANNFKKAGLKVVLGAADTFRAAAVDQLTIWAKRVDVPIVSRGMGADPSAVAYDAVQSAVAQKADIVIIDTAGRLHNKAGLMNELTKIKRVMQKVVPSAPHEVLLVLDASTGQNAVEQCKEFTKATDVTALALTKLDGTAKGGVVIGISDQFKIPVRYIGVGEKMEDLRMFDRQEFVESLFKR
ncbi:MAG TPA: signal recognition particle-docking protein FtsY [Bacteroidia bacterium]|jgi:fused signal recognition particle receptor|nr:signal recognition particle-docking protein FtsY [Bacteroidia bacterium]